jgi:hypothetical protein
MKIRSLVFASSIALLAGYVQQGISAPAPARTENPGEVVGTAAPGSSFAKLKLGMYSKEVTDLVGQPNDQKIYMTGKAWIPFHFGGDNSRTEYHYKGQGVLTFANGGINDMASMKLIKITNNPNESGYVH